MSTVTKIVQDLRKRLTGATAEIQNEIARLRTAIADKRKDLERTQRAPLPLEEIIERIVPQVVAEEGELWLRDYGSALVRGDNTLGSPNARGSRRLPWRETLPWAAMCAARPDLAAELLGALVRRVVYEPGPASAERPALVEKLARELAELEAAEEMLIDDAAGSGVVIEHRREVIQRREAERRRGEREEQAARDRAARQAALDARHREEMTRGRAVLSPYIIEGRREAPS